MHGRYGSVAPSIGSKGPQGALARYAFAIVITALVIVANVAVSRHGDLPVFSILFGAVAAATWFGGAVPGLISTAFCIGEVTLYLVRKSPVFQGNGAFIRYAGLAGSLLLVWYLISAMKRSGEELRRMNLRFGGVVQISEDAIISIDEQQRITLFNPGAQRIFGYSPDEALGKSINLLIPERYHSVHKREVDQFAIAPDVLRPMRSRETIYGLRKDGTEFPAEASISRFEVGGEKVMTVRLRDISQMVSAERGLRELAAIVESSEDAIVGENLEGLITSWNSGAAKMYGYAAEEVIGAKAAMLVPSGRGEEVDSNVRRALSGEAFRVDTVRLRKDGKPIQVSLTVSPIKDREGNVIGVSTITRDISERKKLEEQLRQSQKMEAIGRLAGGIAHDFNNLLSIIVGYTYVLQSSLPDDEALKGSAQQVMHAAEKASALTRQLLAFSRKQVLQAAVISLNDIIVGMGKMLPRLIGEDIDLRMIAAPKLKSIKADPGQIEQVIMNLVVNARDAMPDGGKLTIETADVCFDEDEARHHGIRAGDYVLLAVTDTGVGMDQATQAHIFEPFFTTKEPGRGTGLGLATVYGIVSQSNGYIWVYSEPGRGTTFKIYFPTTNAESGNGRISQGPTLTLTGSESVLLVEDEHKLRALIERVLTGHGYKVVSAGTGKEALEKAAQMDGRIDLLLTDVVMPAMGGQLAAEALRNKHPGMRVLFMSGYTDNALMHMGELQSGIAFLQKPFTPDVLLRKIREVLDMRDEEESRKVV